MGFFFVHFILFYYFIVFYFCLMVGLYESVGTTVIDKIK